MVKVLTYGFQVVVDDNGGFSSGAHGLKDFKNLLFAGGIDSGERFIHQGDRGILGECTGQEYALLLAARKLRDLAMGKILHSDGFEGGLGAIMFGFAGALEPSE